MPGAETRDSSEAPRLDDVDDIQTLKNLLELRIRMKREERFLEAQLD